MKRIFSILLGIILVAAPAGCASEPPQMEQDDGTLQVVATIFPGYDFARAVGGEQVSLTMLLPPGSETHSFEPTIQDIAKIQSCDLFLYTGGESDAWVDGILDSIDTANVTILKMMDAVNTVEEEQKEGMEAEHDEQEGDEPEYDEHVWTSPVNAIKICKAVEESLSALDPEHKTTYRANCDAYAAQLQALDGEFRAVTQSAVRDTLIFADRFPFRYFVDEYGLNYYAAFPGCSTETEASAQTVAFLIDKVKDEKLPVVFYIEFSNEKMADTICEATGAEKRLLHSCHNVTKSELEQGVTYVELMTQNVEALRKALA